MKNFVVKLFIKIRVAKYAFLSSNKNISGKVFRHQPVIFVGKGAITFGTNVHIGVFHSPGFYNGYAYLEARTPESAIVFGNNVHINNNFSAASEKRITIKNNVLIGSNCEIIDSAFHNLNNLKRNETDPSPLEIIIEDNVFIGNKVTILKGVTIGKNSVIANGAVVTKSFPENVVIAGVPAKIINNL